MKMLHFDDELVAEKSASDHQHRDGLDLDFPFPVPSKFAARRWMKWKRAQRVVGNSWVLRRLTIGMIARIQFQILRGHKDPEVLRRIQRCRRESESLLTGNEAFILYSLAQAQSRRNAPMAEVGVFQGSSARIICEAKSDCPLHLFDTFSGLPQPAEGEHRTFRTGQFSASLSAVSDLLSRYPAVIFHPGRFPSTSIGLEHLRFSFVHLDADLYDSTFASLDFFYPRMVANGIILTHDYSTVPGVAQAFADFFAVRPEAIIELPTSQAMIVVRS